MVRAYVASGDIKTFLTYTALIQSAATVTFLMLWIIYRGSWLNKGFLLLSASNFSSIISTVTSTFIIWGVVVCSQVYYQITYIMWRIKDVCLHSYLLLRTDALTARRFRIWIKLNVFAWVLFNLFRLASLFSCWGGSNTDWFTKTQPILERIESIWLFYIDTSCALMLFFHYIKTGSYRNQFKSNVFKITFRNSNWIFIVVLFISIPAYIFYILETFDYYDSSFVNFFIFEENTTSTLLTAEFLNLSIWYHYSTSQAESFKKIQSKASANDLI